uniref:Lipoxygenase n=1 Tax=Taxus x media TaxID=85957 RepID=A0A873P7R6_9CONI|nr:13-lipoxygenase [Taxus x media]
MKGFLDNIPVPSVPTWPFNSKDGDGHEFDIKAENLDQKVHTTDVTAVITVQQTLGGVLTQLGLSGGLVFLVDVLGSTLLIELITGVVDPDIGSKKPTNKAYAHRAGKKDNENYYTSKFKIPDEFGEVGAISVTNEHHREMFVKNITIDGVSGHSTTLRFTCNSWIHSKFDNKQPRIFFVDKSHLPTETPGGLKSLRKKELEILRGNGTGESKLFERIYDYDVYNDLGEPDKGDEFKRPVLGGAQEHPYPRRCRTGRAPAKKDRKFESLPLLPTTQLYVPPDEAFPDMKLSDFWANLVRAFAHSVVPTLKTICNRQSNWMEDFTAIYSKGIPSSINSVIPHSRNIHPRLVVKGLFRTQEKALLRFGRPEIIDRDRRCWFRDEEFARQALAGLNPMAIQLVQTWPTSSKLDPEVYGPQQSSVTKDHIEQEIGGVSLEKALEEKRLFILDYYDAYMPYIERINKQSDELKMYASRTLFFFMDEGTLRPVAIELCLPPIDVSHNVRNVYTSAEDATEGWLWKVAKAHCPSNRLHSDAGSHQLANHWLRTHACLEPYIIAAHRQLSAMHPIFKLLLPHMRYTLEINADARQCLINYDGVIESLFTRHRKVLELSSILHQLVSHWLRTHACTEPYIIAANRQLSAMHPIYRLLHPHPYANDGLLIWSAIGKWVHVYVLQERRFNYYPQRSASMVDCELQRWPCRPEGCKWNVGHGDKKDEPWWPHNHGMDDLIQVLTTKIWIASGQHAAPQYPYGGYVPNRPKLFRKAIPIEERPRGIYAVKCVLHYFKQQVCWLCYPCCRQIHKMRAVWDRLSTHSPDEEYIRASKKHSNDLMGNWCVWRTTCRRGTRILCCRTDLELRNFDISFYNRAGAGCPPYELYRPEEGVTAFGFPNSVSI